MKIKTNLRAGQGGSPADTSTSTSSSGLNSGGSNSGRLTDVVPTAAQAYAALTARCTGL
jgi:hypothetical protein